MKNKYENRGSALVIATLVAGSMLSIAFGISSILFKEILSFVSSERSYHTFHIADTAFECALLHDFIYGSFDRFDNLGRQRLTTGHITCNNKIARQNPDEEGDIFNAQIPLSYTDNKVKYKFYVHDGEREKYCARVVVTKEEKREDASSQTNLKRKLETTVETVGLNPCGGGLTQGQIKIRHIAEY
ncbi:MAG: hypothetical protein OXU73_02765 [Candidatus Campbellbacteria bacterium]|nr:hypothetical protein [Candidatus Campbellbacteria bacterium]